MAGARLGRLTRARPPAPAGDALAQCASRWTRHTYHRNQVLYARLFDERIAAPYPPIVAGPDPLTLTAPLILTAMHFGPLAAIGALLGQLPGRTLSLIESPHVPRRDSELLVITDVESERVAVLRRALLALRDGAVVFATADGITPGALAAELLGRPIVLSRGAFALSRLSGAPILPLAVRWRRSGVEIFHGPPLAPASEDAMAAAFMQWLGQRLAGAPEP